MIYKAFYTIKNHTEDLVACKTSRLSKCIISNSDSMAFYCISETLINVKT